ncbi:uncharacterized protein METZ01_LOCUS429134, partial [marine metagenome]
VSRLLPIALSLLLIGLGCGKPVNGSKEDVPSPIPAKSPDEILVKKISEEPLIKPEEKRVKAVRFDRKDPNQLRIGSTIDAVLRKRKNNAKSGSRGLKLVPSRAAPVLLIEEVEQLEQLDLTGRNLSDIACLSQLTHFTSLYLSNNRLSKLQPLSKHRKLLALTLDGNKLEDLSPLAALTELNLLSCDSNQVSDLKPLAQLNHLKYLYLGNNGIARLDPLKELENLVALDLSANQ